MRSLAAQRPKLLAADGERERTDVRSQCVLPVGIRKAATRGIHALLILMALRFQSALRPSAFYLRANVCGEGRASGGGATGFLPPCSDCSAEFSVGGPTNEIRNNCRHQAPCHTTKAGNHRRTGIDRPLLRKRCRCTVIALCGFCLQH